MFARNRNILSFGLVAALVSGFSSCTEVPVDTQQLVNHQVHDEYVANFVAKYGQPSPNQTWDFSGRVNNNDFECDLPLPEVGTRAISSAAVGTFEAEELGPDIQWTVLGSIRTPNERDYIDANLDNAPELDWNPYEIVDMWVWWTHGNGNEFTSYGLGIYSIEPNTGSYNHGTQYYTNVPYLGTGYNSIWYYGPGHYAFGNQAVGARIDASALNDPEKYEDVYWYAAIDGIYFDAEGNNMKEYELKKYKAIETPYGALYWCFDCDHDGDYRDLVCLVEPATVKRYLIEDLGALDDFDFNDIVVDVATSNRVNQETLEVTTSQKAFVRAMGGTLDFTLTIGNTTWSKSGNNYDPTIAVNADAGTDNTALIAEFPVEGWDPDANNISVSVKKKETTTTGGDVVVTFPFPKAGEVPMIIAVSPTTYFDKDDSGAYLFWMPERVSIPAKYFTEVETTEP